MSDEDLAGRDADAGAAAETGEDGLPEAGTRPDLVEDDAGMEAEAAGGGTAEDGIAEADTVEFDFGGTKARFAKDAPVADAAAALQAYARQVTAGANQKFQDAAEIRKSAEAAKASLDRLSELNTDALEAYAAAAGIRDRIGALEGIDLQRLWQVQPDQARRLSDELSSLRQQQALATDRLDRVQADIRRQHGARREAAMAEGRQKVARLDPGFDRQAAEVVDYVQQAYGLSAEQAEAWPLSPEIAVMARKAMLWDRAQGASKARRPGVQAQEARPVRSLAGTGGGAAAGPQDRQGVDAWMRDRNRQLARRQGG